MSEPAVESKLQQRVHDSLAITREMFLAEYGHALPIHKESATAAVTSRLMAEYAAVKDLPPPVAPTAATKRAGPSAAATNSADAEAPPSKRARLEAPAGKAAAKAGSGTPSSGHVEIESDEGTIVLTGGHSFPSVPGVSLAASNAMRGEQPSTAGIEQIVGQIPETLRKKDEKGGFAVMEYAGAGGATGGMKLDPRTQLILAQREKKYIKPVWHAPWKLMRVISGHIGWVRTVAFSPDNEWFATGSNDRTIKIWDLASGALKLTLTGHINSVMDLAVSPRHPYLFSVGQDRLVKCWDLEQNKVVRSYHGHLHGVYCCAVHPTLDLLFSAGRDSCARMWDIRTKAQVRVFGGHKQTVGSIVTQGTEPQLITGSHDCTMRLWDIAAGKATAVLTNHKKSVRGLALHPKEYTFISGAADNIKVWKCPEGQFLRNMSGHNAIVNTVAVNQDDVMVSAADNGSMHFWDYKSGYSFQQTQTVVQPGSLDSEAGIFMAKFDMTGSRLVTCEADKTIKVWKEDENATPESHPIDFKPQKKRNRF